MTLDEVLELTPKTVWYLYQRAQEVDAQDRLLRVEDMSAVEAPAQLEKGMDVRNAHVKSLLARAGIRPAGYTD